MPAKRNRTSAPACQRKRSNADSSCDQIVTRRFERVCIGSMGALCIVVACMAGDATCALVSAYGTLLLTLSIGGIGLW